MLPIGLTKLTGPFSNPLKKNTPANEKNTPAAIAYIKAMSLNIHCVWNNKYMMINIGNSKILDTNIDCIGPTVFAAFAAKKSAVPQHKAASSPNEVTKIVECMSKV